MTENSHHGFWAWLHLECVTPFLLVLLVLPLNVMAGPYTWDNVGNHAAHTLASGEMAAVAFCLLSPMVLIANRIDAEGKLGLQLTFGMLLAGGFYWLTKFLPAIPPPGTIAVSGRPIVYSFMSIAVSLFAIATAVSIKKATHGHH
jgi:hypothetical protein